MTVTATIRRLKVMFLNAAGSEIRNLISVPCLFWAEKLLPTKRVLRDEYRSKERRKMWDGKQACVKSKTDSEWRRTASYSAHTRVCECTLVHVHVLALRPYVFIKHITAPSRFLTCTPPACYIWPTNHKIRNHAYISITNGLLSPFNMQISWNITECLLF